MADRFHFLSTAEFERLSAAQKLTYLSDAMEELELSKAPRDGRGWHSLFSESVPQDPLKIDPEPSQRD